MAKSLRCRTFGVNLANWSLSMCYKFLLFINHLLQESSTRESNDKTNVKNLCAVSLAE